MRAVSPFRCHRIAFLACVLVPVLAGPAAPPAAAQAIDRDAYLTYVPLEYPPLVARPRANVDFALFGEGVKLDLEVDGRAWHTGAGGGRKTAEKYEVELLG